MRAWKQWFMTRLLTVSLPTSLPVPLPASSWTRREIH